MRIQAPPDPRRPHSAIALPSLDILEERQPLECLEPVFYFLVVQLAQPIKAELFDREGGHHAPKDDGPAERLFAEIARAGQVSHKPAGEAVPGAGRVLHLLERERRGGEEDRKSTRLNSSHSQISYAVFCLKKKKKQTSRQSHNDNHTSDT